MAKFVVGYDPGGAKANGISYLELSDELKIRGYEYATCSSADEAMCWLFDQQKISPNEIICAGIDTLMSWATVGAFRPMDHFLRQDYPEVSNSIFSVNSAFGSMAIQGMVFAHVINECAPNLMFINETHPKVAYYAQTGRRHDYVTRPSYLAAKHENGLKTARRPIKKTFNEEGAARMWNELLQWINQDAGSSVYSPAAAAASHEDHEWDALYSAWFTYHYGLHSPSRDLMRLHENDLLTINLKREEADRIEALRGRCGDISLVRHLENRIIVPNALEEKVKYLWLPAS